MRCFCITRPACLWGYIMLRMRAHLMPRVSLMRHVISRLVCSGTGLVMLNVASRVLTMGTNSSLACTQQQQQLQLGGGWRFPASVPPHTIPLAAISAWD